MVIEMLQKSFDDIDDVIDKKIENIISCNSANSFYLFAGAGSGKTKSLVRALETIRRVRGRLFSLSYQQVAVITYTNAACNEIIRRTGGDNIFFISTIHSFVWNLIRNYQKDIKKSLTKILNDDLNELRKRATKSSNKKMVFIRARMERIKNINKFKYSPAVNNYEYDSLSHDEVLKIGVDFIKHNNLVQKILINKFPICFIDECQDTKKELMEALFAIAINYKESFSLGLFGDEMQRVYFEGKEHILDAVPDNWVKLEKQMNHRSAKRIVKIANDIRQSIDGLSQLARSDAQQGVVRMYITSNSFEKEKIENKVAEHMASVTGDENWLNENEYKCLILEHHMAAERFNFEKIFNALKLSSKFKTSMLTGDIPEIVFLGSLIIPLRAAYVSKDNFGLMRVIKNMIDIKKKINTHEYESETIILTRIQQDVDNLMNLWNKGVTPRCIDILKEINKSKFFNVPSRINDIVSSDASDELIDENEITVLKKAFDVDFDEFVRYFEYVRGQTRFATHQGVKGLEFPRVMMIIDDNAKGNMFSYEKLFGTKELSKVDIENEKAGKDTSIKKTIRLFYVGCTRAMDSLAIVMYTNNVEQVKSKAVKWFDPQEIVLL